MRSCGNKYKSVSPAVTDTRFLCSSSADFCNATSSSVCVCVCVWGVIADVRVFQINRFFFKRKKTWETVVLTGQDLGLWVCAYFLLFLVCV